MKKHFMQESDSQDQIYDQHEEDSSYVDDPKLQMKGAQGFMEPLAQTGNNPISHSGTDKALKGNGRRSYNMPI